MRTAEQKISAALGTTVQISNFAFHLSSVNPTVDIYNAVVAGAAPYTNPPVLQVDHLRIGIQITSMLHRQWNLSDLTMEHPVARVLVNPNGSTNLPKGNGQDQASIFDIGIRHVTISQGEIYYNDRKSVIDADFHDLALQSSFSPALKRYSVR